MGFSYPLVGHSFGFRYLNSIGVDSLYGFVIGVLLTTPIWYYRKREKQILSQMAQLKENSFATYFLGLFVK